MPEDFGDRRHHSDAHQRPDGHRAMRLGLTAAEPNRIAGGTPIILAVLQPVVGV